VREIIFFETDFGNSPVEEFLAGLDSAARAKVVRTLELLRTQQIVPAKFWKKLSGSDLWEVRVEYAGNIYRVLAALRKIIESFSCTPSKRNRRKLRVRIWKLLYRGKSGIFNVTAICERRPPKVP
jgi:hypothetical protein